MKAIIILLVYLNPTLWKDRDCCSFAVIGGNDWDKDRERGGEVRHSWRTCQSTCRTLSSLSESMRAFPVFCRAVYPPSPPHPPVFLTLRCFLSRSRHSSVSVPFFPCFCHLFVFFPLPLITWPNLASFRPFPTLSPSYSFSLSIVPFRTVALCGQLGEVLIWPCAVTPTEPCGI